MENNYKFKINSLEDITGVKVLVEKNNIEKPNFSKIGRELCVSSETVRKYYNGFKKKNTKCRKSKVDTHHKRILDLLNDELKQFLLTIIFGYLHATEYLQHKYDIIYHFSCRDILEM